jgi:crotonobetainyl-CoA:carnitine CoA-transferase CaiB-like acyl-CoA transferase
VLANGYLRTATLNDGSQAQLVANPVQFDEKPWDLSGAPECGQQTEEVLLELGVAWDEIARYKEEKAIL